MSAAARSACAISARPIPSCCRAGSTATGPIITSGSTRPSSAVSATGQHWIDPTSRPSSTAAKLSAAIGLACRPDPIGGALVPVGPEGAIEQRFDRVGGHGIERYERDQSSPFPGTRPGDSDPGGAS